MRYTLCILYYTVYSKLHTSIQYTVYICTVYNTVYRIQYTVYNIHYTVTYTAYYSCILYTAYCIRYTVWLGKNLDTCTRHLGKFGTPTGTETVIYPTDHTLHLLTYISQVCTTPSAAYAYYVPGTSFRSSHEEYALVIEENTIRQLWGKYPPLYIVHDGYVLR